MKNYSIRYRKYNIFVNNYISYIKDIDTNDIYHEIGKIICNSIERISSISYTLNKNGITEDIIDFRQNLGFTKLSYNIWIDETRIYDIYGNIVHIQNFKENIEDEVKHE